MLRRASELVTEQERSTSSIQYMGWEVKLYKSNRSLYNGSIMKINRSDIEKILAFRDIEDESKEKIIAASAVKTLKKGTTLFSEKDEINSFYAILEGKVSLSRYSGWGQKRIFFILGEGELINEVVFDDLPVSVVCEVFETCRIVEFKKKDFLKIMEEDFKLVRNIMNSMGKKQRRLYRQLKNTVPIKMDKKLAAKLWKLARDYGEPSGEWTVLQLKITVTNLSDMLGTSRETISRAMKILLDDEIIQWEDKKLLVKEEKLLEYYRDM